ncbi:MAG: hypothetical protein AAF721_22080 [Myxococcota bacterium]
MPVQPNPRRVWTSVGKFRRGGAALIGVGAIGLAAAVGMQVGRGQLLARCVRTGNPESDTCVASDILEAEVGPYATVGMGMMVAASAGAGGMFGNADATRDVQIRGGKPKVPSFAKFTGIVAVGLTGAWALGRNLHFGREEERCEDDLACVARVRPKRWLANDLATLAISAGAGFIGYSIAYEKQAKALMTLRVQPSVSRTHAGASLTMAF